MEIPKLTPRLKLLILIQISELLPFLDNSNSSTNSNCDFRADSNSGAVFDLGVDPEIGGGVLL